MKKITFGEGKVTLERTQHPVIARTHTAELHVPTTGWAQFDVADLRVLAAAAAALADEIERDTRE